MSNHDSSAGGQSNSQLAGESSPTVPVEPGLTPDVRSRGEFPRASARAVPVERRRGWMEGALVAAAMAVVVWFFHWTVSANSGFQDWGDMDYFKLMVRGWQKGQLNLDKEPAPELLALADPYDPAQNEPYKLGDATLYKGKYYIYFGPAPALTLMLPYAVLTGRQMTMGAATFWFVTAGFLTASFLFLAIRRRYFPASGLLMAPLGVLALGFGTHLLALAQRPMIWELPISAAIAFTLFGIAACYRAIHGNRPLLAMAVAGLCLGLAIGSRPICLVASGLLLVPVVLAWREQAPGRSWWRLGLAAAVPLGLCGVALMAHNYARFDNPLEWGQHYQLSGAYEGKLVHFSLRFLLHNFSVYFFQLLGWSGEFPFALARGIEISHIPDYFGTEEVAGLAVTFPFVWFVLALPLAWFRRDDLTARHLTATIGSVAGYALPVMALVMGYFSTTTRYQTDFAVAFALLALIGMLALERWAQTVHVRFMSGGLRALAVMFVAVTVFIGTLMSFDYHARSLLVTAPKTWAVLENRTGLAVATVGKWLGQLNGPRELKVRFKVRPVGTIETFWQPLDARAPERILVEHIGEQLIRFGYERGGQTPVWGRPLSWKRNHTHTVSVQLPSLYPASGDGWSGAARRAQEFQERSCVAVWFSGGRALSRMVEPWPGQVTPGGGVGRDFTGEIRSIKPRLFREDEIESGLAQPWAARGGVLTMRIVFPPKLPEQGEPIFAAGAHYRSSIVFVQPVEGGIKIVFENYSLPRIESDVIKPNPAGHFLELEMASFDPAAYGVEATGDVVVRLDGKEVMRTWQVAYPFPWGHERIGENPFGTTCAAQFRGWITDARWIR